MTTYVGSDSSGYKTYTSSNVDTMTNFTENIITPHRRYFSEYELLLKGLSGGLDGIRNFIKYSSHKISYLDSGAGSGCAISTLFGDPVLKDSLERCDGISYHLFKPVENLLKLHPKKVTWYHGDAKDIMKDIPQCSYDLITDIWGAYFYSPHQAIIMRQYHRLLKPGGRCYIIIRHKNSLNNGRKSKAAVEKYLSKRYPSTFRIYSHNWRSHKILVIRNWTNRFPIPGLRVTAYQLSYVRKKKKRSQKEMVDGCAIYPYYVKWQTEDKHPQLRPLSYVSEKKAPFSQGKD